MLKKQNVEIFSLYTDKITANYPGNDFQYGIIFTSLNLVKVLFDLSSLVRGLHIHQQLTPDIQIGGNYLLGIHNADWTAIILEMFSRKLDKLWIENSLYKGYLSHEGIETLKEVGNRKGAFPKKNCMIAFQKLPLIDKKIWFVALISSGGFYLKGTQKENNGNIVKGIFNFFKLV